MAAAFYNKQTVSPLLLFHVNKASERNVIPAMVQSEVTVHKILSPQPRDIWEIVFFDVILSLAIHSLLNSCYDPNNGC